MTMLLLNVFGGLAIFIFGMKLMSDGLHTVAGEKMRSVLRLFSANRLVAICSGAAVTAVIQSSSASTVMVIGFINAGLLNLVQAIGIIFGANIGTTITAQLIAFDIGWIIMPSIILGLLISFIPRHPFSGWGNTILGLGLLFLGMQFMSDELKQLSTNPGFVNAFQLFQCAPVNGSMPVLATLGATGVGLVATLVLQSSSACTGIIIALGASGLLDIYTAVALVMGSNIGTTITAQLAAIPANRLAKQAALAHTLFNVLGVLLMFCTFWITWDGLPAFFRAVENFGGDLPRKIANSHTIFNVTTTLVLCPFIPLLAKLCEKIVPVRSRLRYKRLEPLLLDTPSLALVQTSDALRKMLKKSWRMVHCAFKLYDQTDKKNIAVSERLDEWEREVDARQKEISEYLSHLMVRHMTPAQAEQIPLLLHCTNDAERIGDHTSIIRDLMKSLHEGNHVFSAQADTELRALHRKLTEQAQNAVALLSSNDNKLMSDAGMLGREILRMTDQCEKTHLQRLSKKQCTAMAGILFLEIIEEIRKVSRHLSNITERAGLVYRKMAVPEETPASAPVVS